MSDIVEGEMIGLSENKYLVEDRLHLIKWKTKDGQYIPVPELADSHLRNIALFLMGMGYQGCIATNDKRVLWLSVLRMEWERRLRTDKRIIKV